MNNYTIVLTSIIVGLIISLIISRRFYKSYLFNEILKEKTPDGFRYSQGRVYLLLSIICYYITIGLMTSKALKPNMDIDTKTLEMIIEALQWAIALMAGYVFGSKGLEVVKTIMNLRNNNK